MFTVKIYHLIVEFVTKERPVGPIGDKEGDKRQSFQEWGGDPLGKRAIEGE